MSENENPDDDPRPDPPEDSPIRGPGWDGLHDDRVNQDSDELSEEQARRDPIAFGESIHESLDSSPLRRQYQDDLERLCAKNQRITVKVAGDDSEITLNGQPHPIKFEEALFLDILLKAGTWVSGTDMRKQDPPFLDRPDRVRDRIMKKAHLAGLIESDHKGYRLRPDLLE